MLTEALMALHKAGRIKGPWLPGMRLTDKHGVGMRLAFVFDERASDRLGVPFLSMCVADLTDPATVGCLLALLREATSHCVVTDRHVELDDTPWWSTTDLDADEDLTTAATEGEAIALALIALAGAP